jgi:hypothetical protein
MLTAQLNHSLIAVTQDAFGKQNSTTHAPFTLMDAH